MRSLCLLVSLFVFFLNSCGNEKLAYHHEISQQKHISKSYSVSTLVRGHASIILVFDVSGSMGKEIEWVSNAIEEALTILTSAYFKTPWKLAILGSSVATARSTNNENYNMDKDILGTTVSYYSPVVAMNFVGFPEEAIMEQQSSVYNSRKKLDDKTKQKIRKEEAPITNETPNHIEKIKEALWEVRNWGSLKRYLFSKAYSEELFYAPVIVSLKRDPSFIEPGGHVAIFYFGDVEDQSHAWGEGTSIGFDSTIVTKGTISYGGNGWTGITHDEYLNELLGMVNNNISKIFMGGGFSALDLQAEGETRCRGEGNFLIQGSTFEELINKTAKTPEAIISNCSPREEFQALFVKLFELLAHRIQAPTLLIGDSGEPICASSIKVYYNDILLPKGGIESGGSWKFDWRANLIRFNDLEFIDKDDDNAEVRVEFDVDDGLDDSC